MVERWKSTAYKFVGFVFQMYLYAMYYDVILSFIQHFMVYASEWRQGTDAKSGRRQLKNVRQEDLFDNKGQQCGIRSVTETWYMYSSISNDNNVEKFDVGSGLSHLLTPIVDFSMVV